MSSLESEFQKEFKTEVGVFVPKDVLKVPLPPESSKWEVHKEDCFLVKDVEDGYYGKLNETKVWRLPSNAVAKRRKIDKATRSFMRDNDGNFVYEDVKIPVKSMVVVSDKAIGLPFKYKCDGFDYIDYTIDRGIRKYLYVIPKKNLYRVHQTALAVSVKNMRHYEGMGYNTWRMGMIYLHIIPYKPSNTYTGTRILLTRTGLNYSREICSIVRYWEQCLFIPNMEMCEVFSGNLVTKMLDVSDADYVEVDELSLGDKEIYGSDGETVN